MEFLICIFLILAILQLAFKDAWRAPAIKVIQVASRIIGYLAVVGFTLWIVFSLGRNILAYLPDLTLDQYFARFKVTAKLIGFFYFVAFALGYLGFLVHRGIYFLTRKTWSKEVFDEATGKILGYTSIVALLFGGVLILRPLSPKEALSQFEADTKAVRINSIRQENPRAQLKDFLSSPDNQPLLNSEVNYTPPQ